MKRQLWGHLAQVRIQCRIQRRGDEFLDMFLAATLHYSGTEVVHQIEILGTSVVVYTVFKFSSGFTSSANGSRIGKVTLALLRS